MAIRIDVVVVVIDRGVESVAFNPFVGMLVGSCFKLPSRSAQKSLSIERALRHVRDAENFAISRDSLRSISRSSFAQSGDFVFHRPLRQNGR